MGPPISRIDTNVVIGHWGLEGFLTQRRRGTQSFLVGLMVSHCPPPVLFFLKDSASTGRQIVFRGSEERRWAAEFGW